MKAVRVTKWEAVPAFTDSAPDPSPPSDTQVRIKVLASGLSRLVRMQATGGHYSSKAAGLPYTPGADGVGTTEDGKRVYFSSIQTGGGFAEFVNVPKQAIVPLTDDAADAVQVAALVNPAMSSWMALKTRVSDLKLDEGFSMLVLGATSLSGRVAINFARSLGAKRIIGVARNEKAMADIGLDEVIVIKSDSKTDYSKLGHVDIVLDYLYGQPLVDVLTAVDGSKPVQVVQIGTMASGDVPFPAALLRSKNITLRGSGPGSWSMAEFGKELPIMLAAVEKLPRFDIKERKLEQVEAAWSDTKERLVFVP